MADSIDNKVGGVYIFSIGYDYEGSEVYEVYRNRDNAIISLTKEVLKNRQAVRNIDDQLVLSGNPNYDEAVLLLGKANGEVVTDNEDCFEYKVTCDFYKVEHYEVK